MNQIRHTETQKYTGVSPVRRGPRSGVDALPWQAHIRAGSANIVHLGIFATQADAARAYDNAAYYLHLAGRKTVTLNFPNEYYGPHDSSPMSEATEKAVELFKAAQSSRIKVRRMRGDADVQRTVKAVRWELKLMPPLLGGPKHLEAATQLDKAIKYCEQLIAYLLPLTARNSQPVAPSVSPVNQREAKAEPVDDQQALARSPEGIASEPQRVEPHAPTCDAEGRSMASVTAGPESFEGEKSDSPQKSSENRATTQSQHTISVRAGVNN